MSIQLSNPTALTSSIRALTCGLERAGWSIRCFELDMTTERAKIELARYDGDSKRIVTFFSRDGQASIERFTESRQLVRVGRRGDSFLASQLRTDFLGRSSYPGARVGLRYLCSYLADNSTRQLSASEVRALLAPVMSTPVALSVEVSQ